MLRRSILRDGLVSACGSRSEWCFGLDMDRVEIFLYFWDGLYILVMYRYSTNGIIIYHSLKDQSATITMK
jgi:hypothetical protein